MPLIGRIDVHVFRAPIAVPVLNSFGAITARPMTLVGITDSDGVVGWGEIWCNFPQVGAEHRARLVTSVFTHLLIDRPADRTQRGVSATRAAGGGAGAAWLEEPIAADAPWSVWQTLAASVSMPLAAGENLRGDSAFEAAIASRSLCVLQPDIGKWGGLSRCVPIGRRAVAAGLRFCPHWLAGGIGLMASLHLRAAVGGDGLAEWDANPNPLRERFPLPVVDDGMVILSDAPGLGFEPDLERLADFRVSL